MDSSSEDGEYQNLGQTFKQDAAQYKVTYSHGRKTKEVDYDKNEEINRKSRFGNNPGRVKRVVSCKRKTHHLTVARRKPLGNGRTHDAANKENEMKCMQDMQQEIFDMDPWEFPLNVNKNDKTGRTGSERADYCMLNELTRDHSTMTDVLFGRNLRLKVSLTLWQRNVGELLTYFLRIQDIGVFVDFLPLISKSIDEDTPRITIGCCVDLFPLVKKVLTHPYEENLQVFNQQLSELWHQVPLLKFVPGAAGDMAKVIDSFLSQLS
ncbi:KATNB1-like protein 1 [Pempheris klunzingeri]|uniref:KATNB1-like protein 1 n=1 Tax=Pempheris klunzingeri TaxID=3127111 RepID=UPI003980A868